MRLILEVLRRMRPLYPRTGLPTLTPMTNLITLYACTMSCQPGPPRARHGQWPRWQQRPVGYTFPYKLANFHGVYLKLSRIDFSDFFIWYSEKCLSYRHKISKWYDEPVLCYHRVKMCNFAMCKQGPSHYFHLHARAPPSAVPVDERIESSPGLFTHPAACPPVND